VGLALEGKAERYKKHQRNRESLETMSHSVSSGEVRLKGPNLNEGEDAMRRQKFRFDEYFRLSKAKHIFYLAFRLELLFENSSLPPKQVATLYRIN
jgi:hypothetical protein